MYTPTFFYLLPLLPFVIATSQETRELYEAASRKLVSRDDTDSHGHGKYNALLNSHGHGHISRKRNLSKQNHSTGQKLVRRKKVNHKNKRGNSTCKSKSTQSESESVIATISTTATIPAVNNNAIPTSSSISNSEGSETAYSTMLSNLASTSSSWESSSVNQQSSSTSSAQAESTSSSSSSSGRSGNSLFPWGTGSASWTTSDGGLSFNGALKPLTAGKLPSTSNAPDGSNSLIANYPSGTVGLTSAGFSFYTEGSHNGVQVDNAKEVSFSYSVYLENGFEFVKGGKMPGLYGGTSISQAKSCSGGRQDNRDSCFSARLMWRTNGAGEIYDYLPVPYTNTDTGYGESIQRGAYSWATGQWTTVAMRVKLNDIGSANGEQELMVNGKSVISLKDVTFATAEGTKIYGIMAQTFFGGHTDDWASPKDQSIWFKDWSLAVLS